MRRKSTANSAARRNCRILCRPKSLFARYLSPHRRFARSSATGKAHTCRPRRREAARVFLRGGTVPSRIIRQEAEAADNQRAPAWGRVTGRECSYSACYEDSWSSGLACALALNTPIVFACGSWLAPSASLTSSSFRTPDRNAVTAFLVALDVPNLSHSNR